MLPANNGGRGSTADERYRSSPEAGNMGFGGSRAPTIKLDSVLRNFEGSKSFDEWFTKFSLVARYSRWEHEETLVAMLVPRLQSHRPGT